LKKTKQKFELDIPTYDLSDLTDKEEIGRGSFASVFTGVVKRGEHTERLVVKKLLKSDNEEKRNFFKEAKLLHSLKHANIVEIKGVCNVPPALILEYVYFDFEPIGGPGRCSNLQEFLSFINDNNAVDELNFSKVIALYLCSGVAFLHRNGIAHRDIKPQNVLVSNKHYSSLKDKALINDIFQKRPIVCKLRIWYTFAGVMRFRNSVRNTKG